jgi:hypothetical protein
VETAIRKAYGNGATIAAHCIGAFIRGVDGRVQRLPICPVR